MVYFNGFFMPNRILLTLLAAASLSAFPKAVVFDWGNVIGFSDRTVVIDFMCKTLHLTPHEFEKANLQRKEETKRGKSITEFWMEFAKKNEIELPDDFPQKYNAVVKESIGADTKMFALIDRLKERNIRVGMLSNIADPYKTLIADYGFYRPFDPCLLSCETKLAKPDPEAFAQLIQILDLLPDEIVFIDDMQENVDAALKMGLDAIRFESHEMLCEKLSERGLLLKTR